MDHKQTNPPHQEDLVITPGGPRKKNLVHSVGPGHAVRVTGESNATVVPLNDETDVTKGESASMAQHLVLTPGGFRDRALVHQVASGNALHAAGNRMLLMNLQSKAITDLPLPPARVPALGSGWIAYAYWNNGTGNSITSFRTTWRVPAAPASQANQTIFLFNGIQNYGTNFGILQPVLQWGTSAAGGGQYWSIASWYVTSGGQAFHTQLVRVNVGDALVGVMTLTGQTGTTFNYDCQFQGVAGTLLPVQNIAELLWCNETLEAYTVNQCSDYPATDRTALSAISIQTSAGNPSLSWTVVSSIVDCGQRAVVVIDSAINGEVDIFYRAGRRMFHAIRKEDRSWDGFNDASGIRNVGGDNTMVACAGVGNELHVCLLKNDGRMFHAIRKDDRSWDGFNDASGIRNVGSDNTMVACAGVGNELHVCLRKNDGRMFHAIRKEDRSWDGFNDASGIRNVGGDNTMVACAGVTNELHVCLRKNDGRIFHAIRKEDRSWDGFNDASDIRNVGSDNTMVACAGVTNELHVCLRKSDSSDR